MTRSDPRSLSLARLGSACGGRGARTSPPGSSKASASCAGAKPSTSSTAPIQDAYAKTSSEGKFKTVYIPEATSSSPGYGGLDWSREGRGRDDEGRRLRSPGRTLPDGAAGVLLPDARLCSRGRGPGPGDLPEGVAGAGAVRRGSQLTAHLAVPDRDERLPDRLGGPRPPTAAVGAGGRVGPARAARPGRERHLAPALAGLLAGPGGAGPGR